MNNPAWQFEHSAECKASKSFAWSFWTDVSNWERLEGKAVDWIKLDGAFIEGTTGVTKMPGQEPQAWKIVQLNPKQSATIEMTLGGAVFHNRMLMESISEDRTKITQYMSFNRPQSL